MPGCKLLYVNRRAARDIDLSSELAGRDFNDRGRRKCWSHRGVDVAKMDGMWNLS